VDVHDDRGRRIGGIAFRDIFGDSRVVAICATEPDSNWFSRTAKNLGSAIVPAPLSKNQEERLMLVIERFVRTHGLDAQRDPLIFQRYQLLAVQRQIRLLLDLFVPVVAGPAARIIVNHGPVGFALRVLSEAVERRFGPLAVALLRKVTEAEAEALIVAGLQSLAGISTSTSCNGR
jgi:hypothetical protein